jgi:hypothetical protein
MTGRVNRPRVPSLIDLLATGDRAAMDEALDAEVVLWSPFARYDGRADVRHVLSLIARVLVDPVATGTAANEAARYTSLDASVAGDGVQGVIIERHTAAGRLLEGSLYLRPYPTLGRAIAAMSQLLAERPLPSSTRR